MSPKVAVSSQIILKQDVYQELYQDYVIQHSPPATWEVFKDTGVSNLRDAQVHPSYMTCTHPIYLRLLILPLLPLLTPHDLSHQTESHGSTATPTANKKQTAAVDVRWAKMRFPFFVDVNFSINYFCTSYFLSSRLNLEKPLLPHYCYQQKNMIVHSEGKCTSQLLLLFMIFNYILTPCPHHAYYLSPQFKSDFPLLTNNLNSIS